MLFSKHNLTPLVVDADPVVSTSIWVYFAITIPITAIIVAAWVLYDRHKEASYAKSDADLEKDIDHMEKDIMFHLRKRTMSKANTWNSVSPSPAL